MSVFTLCKREWQPFLSQLYTGDIASEKHKTDIVRSENDTYHRIQINMDNLESTAADKLNVE